MNALKKDGITMLLIFVFLCGIGLLLYPTFSDWWNSWNQSRVITDYVGQMVDLDTVRYEQFWEDAVAYNQTIAENGIHWELSPEEKEVYTEQLNMDGTGVMGYIDIPVLDCTVPIYHGTEESTLQSGVGHLEGSSLPVGGADSHCVLSGHRGLPTARLFTDLDRLVEGDVFMIHTMEETLTYEVDQIHIVEPTDFSYLEIVEGEDYCTLITCTPYGINSHRLLVRGHRITNLEETQVRVSADATMKDPNLVALVVAILLLLLIGMTWLLYRKLVKTGRK